MWAIGSWSPLALIVLALLHHVSSDKCQFASSGIMRYYNDSVYYLGHVDVNWGQSGSLQLVASIVVVTEEFVFVGPIRRLQVLRDACVSPSKARGWVSLVAFQDGPDTASWNQTGKIPESLYNCDTNQSSAQYTRRVFPGAIDPEVLDLGISESGDHFTEWTGVSGAGPDLHDENAILARVNFAPSRSLLIDPPRNQKSRWHLAIVRCSRDVNPFDTVCKWTFAFKVWTNCSAVTKPKLLPPIPPPILDERLKVTGPLESGGMCLTYDHENMLVHMDVCRPGEAGQEWYFYGSALKSQGFPSLCLDWTRQRDVYMLKCNRWQEDAEGWRSQQDWYFYGSALATKWSADWCLDWSPTGKQLAYMSDCRHGEAKLWTHRSQALKTQEDPHVESYKNSDSNGNRTTFFMLALSVGAVLLVWRQCCKKTKPTGWLPAEDAEREMTARSGHAQQAYSALAD